MNLNGKQRAALRAMANPLPVVLYIGKEGVTEATIKEAYDALEARELIKCSLLENAPLHTKEACQTLCERLGAAPVQCIGRRFVLFRPSEKAPKIVV